MAAAKLLDNREPGVPPRFRDRVLPSLRNAENAGLPEVAYFVRLLMEEDSARATHCQSLLRKLGSTGSGRPASQPAEHRQ